MTTPPAIIAAGLGGKPVIFAIFAITYLGIALGRVPGLKLNRVGIVLLGAIAMMIFGGWSTANATSCINWPTILLLFGFFVISAQLFRHFSTMTSFVSSLPRLSAPPCSANNSILFHFSSRSPFPATSARRPL
jgi:hypothetical protein